MENKRSRRHFLSKMPFSYYYYYLFSTCLFSICVLMLLLCCSATHLDTKSSVDETNNVHIQATENIWEQSGKNQEGIAHSRSVVLQQRNWFMSLRVSSSSRRHLNGLGSYPPRCKSKCGKCTPCKPVHVPVPPGTSEPTEYYPEAWRCKCGNKLYMP